MISWRSLWAFAPLILRLGCATTPESPADAQGLDVTNLMNAIKGFRGVALADTTPINYCPVALFWDADGSLRETVGRLPPAAAYRRTDCPETANLAQYASITQVVEFPDSLVVVGATRNLMGGRLETYVFRRSGSAVRFREYRVTGVFNFR